MEKSACVMEFKCPCCNAGLIFSGKEHQLRCEYCDNFFEIDTVKAYQESQTQDFNDFSWDTTCERQAWTEDEQVQMRAFRCPSCGGEIVTEETTVATFCPFCDNPVIMPSRVDGILRPDALIPFQKSKEEAKSAFLSLCKGKPLLPKDFTSQQQIEKITGIYVPFWLYDCEADFESSYKATRIHRWSDARYHYTKTDHFLLRRRANASFSGIPMDASSKMDDSFMESLEPYDYTQMGTFHLDYLTGYFTDRYDVPAEQGEERIRQRVEQSIRSEVQKSVIGYSTVVPTSQKLKVNHSKAKYVLFPVWMLNTKYNGNIYTFAMNGQTGKITGSLPVCPKRTAMWFSGICAGVTILATLVQLIL